MLPNINMSFDGGVFKLHMTIVYQYILKQLRGFICVFSLVVNLIHKQCSGLQLHSESLIEVPSYH